MRSAAPDEPAKSKRKSGRIAVLLGVGVVLLLTTHLIFATRTATLLRIRFDFRNWHFSANERVHVMGSSPDAPKEITTTRYFGPVVLVTRRYEGWWNRPRGRK